ncbi:MAG: hypothetical protein RSB35_02270 [Eubacterium sp.]
MDLIDFLNPSKRRGWFGEKLLALLLKILPKEEYEIINDVLIVDDRGAIRLTIWSCPSTVFSSLRIRITPDGYLAVRKAEIGPNLSMGRSTGS